MAADEWEYVFSIEQPINQDVYWLKCIRLREATEEQQYLSRDGWVDYQGFDVMRDPITMTGLRYHSEQRVKQMVSEAMQEALA